MNSVGTKSIGIIVGMVVLAIVACIGLDTRDLIDTSSPKKLGALSSVVILARFDTNSDRFIVTDVWKQSTEASISSVKIGSKLTLVGLRYIGPPPEGKVVFFHPVWPAIPWINPKPKLVLWREDFIRNGRIDDMSVAEFKRACGL
jgi:hypothetical protein